MTTMEHGSGGLNAGQPLTHLTPHEMAEMAGHGNIDFSQVRTSYASALSSMEQLGVTQEEMKMAIAAAAAEKARHIGGTSLGGY